MSSATTNRPPPPLANRHDDLDNYDVGDLSDDPFASPSPPSKKRKEPDQSGLGIDEEVSVQKRARVPNVKLDEERLLGPSGIPKLRTRARHLKIKGKGHEFSDAGRLLSFYQLWLDDLFPKARFLDALAMVEKAGHKKTLITRRNEWINEGKPKTADDYAKELEEAERGDDEATATASAEGRAQQPQQAGRPATPDGRDVPDDDDLYDATPRNTRRTVPIMPNRNDEPDPDDLDALMAEAEGQDTSNQQQQKQTSRPAPPPPQRSGDDEDDIDALIAEAEGHDNANKQKGPSSTSAGQDASRTVDADFADDEAALQEMEGMW